MVRAGLPEAAQAAIAHIRSSGPSRRVGGGRSNVTGRYPSKKMGVTIQFESHRVELPAIVELEHDHSVLEYYDQVPAIKLDYRSADGKRLGVMHTPDFFVIREDGAGWEECKTEDDLKLLADRNPNRYRREGQEWVCPPGQQYAQSYGLYYRVRSSAEINWLFQRNIQFLEDYLRATHSVPPLHRQRVLAYVAAQPGCSLEAVFRAAEGQVTRDEIYALIATGDIYVDLSSVSLPEPARVAVWLEKPEKADVDLVADSVKPLRPGMRLDWDGRAWTIINAGWIAVVLRSSDEEITEIPVDIFNNAVRQGRIRVIGERNASDPVEIQKRLLSASAADLEEATRRFHIVSRALRGEAHEAVPCRTLRRWISAYRWEKNSMAMATQVCCPSPTMATRQASFRRRRDF
jgi:hypothetical protein